MKILLNTTISLDPSGRKTVPLKDVLKDAIFKSVQIKNARELYDKVAGKEDVVDLSVSELADIQQAIDQVFISGVKWQVDDIFNSKS